MVGVVVVVIVVGCILNVVCVCVWLMRWLGVRERNGRDIE